MHQNAGVVYENSVKSHLRKAIEDYQLPLEVPEEPSLGCFNAHEPDLKLIVGGTPFNFEIKGKRAQMGESSFRLNPDTDRFDPTKPEFDPEVSDLIDRDALQPLRPGFERAIDFIRTVGPTEYHKDIQNFPISVTKDAWGKARSKNLVQGLYKNISYNCSLIEQHYNRKFGGTYYIQIQKRGLFYMGDNPLDLPVPRLEGDINIEVRLKRSGSRIHQQLGEKVTFVSIVAVGRLKSSIISPHSLDRPESIKTLFGC